MLLPAAHAAASAPVLAKRWRADDANTVPIIVTLIAPVVATLVLTALLAPMLRSEVKDLVSDAKVAGPLDTTIEAEYGMPLGLLHRTALVDTHETCSHEDSPLRAPAEDCDVLYPAPISVTTIAPDSGPLTATRFETPKAPAVAV